MTSLIETLFGTVQSPTSRGGILHRLNMAMALRRSRIRLQQLDAHMLDDIGLSRDDVESEAYRSVWDAPSTWKG